MYQPAHFAETRLPVLHALMTAHPLGLLMTQDTGGALQADPIPMALRPAPEGEAGPGTLVAHVARANPLWRDTRTDVDVLVVFQGAQAYVSPAWYPGKAEHHKVVPTWNYIVVQARGKLRIHDDPVWVHALVSGLTDHHEARREDAAPRWKVDDAPESFVQAQLRAIVGIEIEIVDLVGKWKMSQNRPAADRAGVAQGWRETAARRGDGSLGAAADLVDPA